MALIDVLNHKVDDHKQKLDEQSQRVKELEVKAGKIDSYFLAGRLVAGILGLSSLTIFGILIFLYSRVSGLNTDLDNNKFKLDSLNKKLVEVTALVAKYDTSLKSGIEKINYTKNNSIKDIESQSKIELQKVIGVINSQKSTTITELEALRNKLLASSNTDFKNNVIVGKFFIRINDLQICWGRKELYTKGLTEIDFNFEFPEPFLGKPFITNSIDNLNADSKLNSYGVFKSSFNEKIYKGALVESNKGKQADTRIRMDYIAIGKWR